MLPTLLHQVTIALDPTYLTPTPIPTVGENIVTAITTLLGLGFGIVLIAFLLREFFPSIVKRYREKT